MTFKKLFITLIITAFTTLAHAETCPSLLDIRNHNFHGWQPYTLDNGTTPSESALDHFTKNVYRFTLAEWMEAAPEGSGHCYYESDINDHDYLGIFLAKHNKKPTPDSVYWRNLDNNVMQCTSSIDKCAFAE